MMPLGSLSEGLAFASLLVKLQCDYASVIGKSYDQHFVSPKGGYEDTNGQALHLNLTAGLYMGNRLAVDLVGDFMRSKPMVHPRI